jgi:hypothetical protein
MKLDARFLVITGLILVAAASRLVHLIPNFEAVTAVALFGASKYDKKIIAFLIPLTALFISDILLGGFYKGMEWTYGSFVVITLLGFLLRKNFSITKLISVSILSSLSIFVITDFGVWLGTSMYPHTVQGFITCYVAAIPFLGWNLLGDLFYCGILFGGFYLAQLRYPKLLKERIK